MLRRAAALAFALAMAGLAAPPAGAAETRCWVDHGAVVVSAAFGDIAGDFLLDLSASQSALESDVAALDGIEDSSARRPLRIGDAREAAQFDAAPLDARTLGFPTTLNGLIGADALRPYVIDLRLSPTCRIGLWRGRAPRLEPVATLPLHMVGGLPAVEATVSDGERSLTGLFAIDTGTAGVRIAAAAAVLSRTAADPSSRLAPPARLAALTLGDAFFQNLPAAVATDVPPGLTGSIGTSVWRRYVVRLDLKRGRLTLADRLSARRCARCGGS